MTNKTIKFPSELVSNFLDPSEHLDDESEQLISEIESNVKAISNNSTVVVNGVYIPNSQLAVKTAEDLCRLSFILKCFEDQ